MKSFHVISARNIGNDKEQITKQKTTESKANEEKCQNRTRF